MQNIIDFFKHPKFQAFVLLIVSLIMSSALLTYNEYDPSLNLATEFPPKNFISYPGAYFADLSYQILGVSIFTLPIFLIYCSINIFCGYQLTNKILYFISLLLLITSLSCVLAMVDLKFYHLNSAGILGLGGLWLLENNIYSEIYIEYLHIALPVILLLSLHSTFRISGMIYISAISWFGSKIWQALKKMNIVGRIISFDKERAFYENNDETEGQPQFIASSSDNIIKKQVGATPSKRPVASKKVGTSSPLPDVNLLDPENKQNIVKQTSQELESRSEQLLSVLADFGVKGEIIAVKEGPVVTMYEFEPAAGTKSSRVIGLADDIARSLSAVSARIAVIPGRNALGIELPNKQRMFFRLRELVETDKFQNPDIQLPLILGKDLSGEPMIADLAKMPHLLVAGTTGSGKSVAINAMIMSLLYRYTPDECKMIMIDPKMLELSAYDNIPHLMTPVVTEPAKAVTALKWAVKEMENRYRLMSHLGVRNIANYNSKLAKAVANKQVLERKIQTGFDPATGEALFETIPIESKKMPFIVIIVDEMADLMLVAGKDIETSIQRLAQMARAAGIHIIMATQRPSVDVITGVIKANFPSRISFKVTSKIDSRTILGEQGSEQLLGMGDMLYMGNSSRILRVHGPFVDDNEVERVTDFLKTTGVPEYVSAIIESTGEDAIDGGFAEDGNSGDLYNQAVDIVKRERKTSISYIQRSLRIGYNKAANLVEEMERQGVLSAPNHSGKREILLPE